VLGKIGDARAVEPLSEALRDWGLRWAAAEALAKIGVPAMESLTAALNRYSARRLARIWDKVWPMPWEGSYHSEREVADLQRFFAICAERGLGLIGWW